MACDKFELERIFGLKNRIEFFDSHQEGGRAAAIVWNGSFVWESGSNRELSLDCTGIMQDGSWINPDNLNEVLENLYWQKVFAERKLDDSTKLFERAKDASLKEADNLSYSGAEAPQTSHLDEIKKLRKTVKRWQRKLSVILDKLHPEPEPIQFSEQEIQRMNQNRSDADNFRSALEKIQI